MRNFGFRNFFDDKSGNFSVVLGLSFTALISAAGMAVDLSNQMNTKSSLQNTVDAATMAGAVLAYDGKPDNLVKEAVKKAFTAQCPITDCNPDLLSITLDGTKIEVESHGSAKTYFMGIFGHSQLDVTAKARVNLGGNSEHFEVHMVLDNTGSMNIVDGVSATNRMKPLFKPYEKFGTTEQCAFACHLGIDGAGQDVLFNGKTGAEIARANGIPMREDRIHREMIDQARRLLTSGNNVKVAVHSFTWGITTMIAPTSNFARVRHAIDDVNNGSQGTQYEHMAPDLDRAVGSGGTGTAASPKKIVVLITDGVQQRLPDHKPGLIPAAMCDKMKENGRELYVLNIAYPDTNIIGGDQRAGGSPAAVRVFYNDIEPALKACASNADHYFRADYGVSIDDALKDVADKILGAGISSLYLSM